MEHHYFLQKNGTSQGPYKLDDLKMQVIQADDSIWRDNLDDWVKASDLDELHDLFIVKSPPVAKENLNDTKLYYFVQQGGIKKGPFKLAELKELTIYFDELIWRSDSDQWEKASEFEELSDIFIIKPPQTPKEQKIAEVNKNFISKIISILATSYVLASLLIGVISFSIARGSWDQYILDTGGKYLPGKNSSYNTQNRSWDSPSEFIPQSELLANKRYPMYERGINLENYYGLGQPFLFRPFKAFYSTIYLTSEEQANSDLLLGHLVLSSFASLSFIFIFIGIVFYTIKRTDLAANP